MKTLSDKEMIIKYLQGKMKASELKKFEKMMTEDDFLRDAVEGYVNNHATPEDLKKIDVNKKVKPKTMKNIYRLIFSGIAAVILIVAVVYIDSIDKRTAQPELLTDNDMPELIIPYGEYYENVYIPEDTIEVTQTNETVKSYTEEFRPKVQEPMVIAESITPLYVNRSLVIENKVPEKNIDEYYRFRSNHRYSYLNGFKIVDYTFKNRNAEKNFNIPNNRNDILMEQDKNVYNITYMAFLEQTLKKINDGNYYDAIEDLNTILDNYPDDDNAIFYKGLCYYEVDKNKQSLKYFEATLNSKINTFHEEAKWYSGLIHKEERQYAVARKVLEEIVYDKGYYGVQAKKELDELYKYYMNE